MNRGAAKQAIFLSARDGRTFLRYVGEAALQVGVEVHALCLMGNHFHLLVRCPDGGLSEFMHRAVGPYVRYLNDRLARDGPIFRGRFRSIPLDTESYVNTVGRYVHRNPLDVRPPVALDAYPWSSYRYYVLEQPHPAWLRVDMLLGEAGSRGAYRSYVEDETAPVEADWHWALLTATAEVVDDSTRHSGIARSAAVALLDLTDGAIRDRIETWLSFPSQEARAMAQLRMRRRAAGDPLVGEIAQRAIRLMN